MSPLIQFTVYPINTNTQVKNICAIQRRAHSAIFWRVPPQIHTTATQFAKTQANGPYVPGAPIRA